MARVLKQLQRVQKSADADAVHDLRVAIRRCRSVATIMKEVDAHRGWRKMRRLQRKLFRALGALRDLHVSSEWVTRLTSVDDPVRPTLLEVLSHREAGPRQKVARAVRTFDEKEWDRLARGLPKRALLVPPNSPTALCLALERFEEMRRLHVRAARTEAPGPWHALRVGLKRFRYAVESLLPWRSAEWDEGLGQIQGLLGQIHDLDVLTSWIKQESDGVDVESTRLRHAVERERRSCIDGYRQRMSGNGSLLKEWNAGLPQAEAIATVTAARLRTTARAMDPHPRRTAAISRLALQLFDHLARSGAEPRFRDGRLRSILDAAAQLHDIRADGRHVSRHKAAGNFLHSVPVPPGWKSTRWNLVAEVVRYHRGAEPEARHKPFAKLSDERQDQVRALAGVLRVARGLHRRSVAAGGVGVDTTRGYVRLSVAGLKDTARTAARLAASKHLLEVYLRRPILIESVETAASTGSPRLAYRSTRSRFEMASDVRRVARENRRARTTLVLALAHERHRRERR